MFNIGFSELLVIILVTLLVVGPGELPVFAQKLGHLFGRWQKMANDFKKSFTVEFAADDTTDNTKKNEAPNE